MRKKKDILCAFCRLKLCRRFFVNSEKSHLINNRLRSADYIYSFPELLPDCPVAMEQPEHEMVIASEPEPILLDSDDDNVYVALFYISQNQSS